MYPTNWPRCACGEPVMDGHLTCGRVTCSESAARDGDRLRECVAKIAGAIDRGECQPQAWELDALAELCRRAGLQQEQARIRRWMGE
jgi:hypothetical protein